MKGFSSYLAKFYWAAPLSSYSLSVRCVKLLAYNYKMLLIHTLDKRSFKFHLEHNSCMCALFYSLQALILLTLDQLDIFKPVQEVAS